MSLNCDVISLFYKLPFLYSYYFIVWAILAIITVEIVKDYINNNRK